VTANATSDFLAVKTEVLGCQFVPNFPRLFAAHGNVIVCRCGHVL
jgi:hypothetical protein